MSNTCTFGSLFAGIGGFDRGFERAGLSGRWQVEIEPTCRQVLARHFPTATRYADITEVQAHLIEPVAVICGGSPCQDLSVAGKRAGLDGARSGLFRHMVRVCKQQRRMGGAKRVVWENVPGALSSNDGRDFKTVLRLLTGLEVAVPKDGWGAAGFVRTPFPSCRWHVAWRVLDSQYFGVPQRRRRIFLVASAGDASCVEILFDPESLCGNPPPRRTPREGPAAGVEGRPAASHGDVPDLSATLGGAGAGGPRVDLDRAGAFIPGEHPGDNPSGTLTKSTFDGSGMCGGDGRDGLLIAGTVSSKWAKGSGGPAGDECQNLVTHTLRAAGHDASEDGTGRGTPLVVLETNDVADPISASEGKTYTHEGKNNFRLHNIVAFDPTQVTNPDNRSQPEEGDPCHTLSKDAHAPAIIITALEREYAEQEDPNQHGPLEPIIFTCNCGEVFPGEMDTPCPKCGGFGGSATYPESRGGESPLAFSGKDDGGDAGDVAPTLRKMGHADSHANGGGQTSIFQPRVARNGRGAPSDVAPALSAQAGRTGKGDSAPCVATFQQSSLQGRGTLGYDESGIAKPCKTQTDGQMIHASTAVRRLTPRECERLQDFDDDWTAWGVDETTGEPVKMSDSRRYGMIGNAVTCAVLEWLGARIRASLTDNPLLPSAPSVPSAIKETPEIPLPPPNSQNSENSVKKSSPAEIPEIPSIPSKTSPPAKAAVIPIPVDPAHVAEALSIIAERRAEDLAFEPTVVFLQRVLRLGYTRASALLPAVQAALP